MEGNDEKEFDRIGKNWKTNQIQDFIDFFIIFLLDLTESC